MPDFDKYKRQAVRNEVSDIGERVAILLNLVIPIANPHAHDAALSLQNALVAIMHSDAHLAEWVLDGDS